MASEMTDASTNGQTGQPSASMTCKHFYISPGWAGLIGVMYMGMNFSKCNRGKRRAQTADENACSAALAVTSDGRRNASDASAAFVARGKIFLYRSRFKKVAVIAAESRKLVHKCCG